MLSNSLFLGIDLGTSGSRIAIINSQNKIIHSDSMHYFTGLERWEDWVNCCKDLITDERKASFTGTCQYGSNRICKLDRRNDH